MIRKKKRKEKNRNKFLEAGVRLRKIFIILIVAK
jgi:hypothetical protein